jgi:hypothetical protein
VPTILPDPSPGSSWPGEAPALRWWSRLYPCAEYRLIRPRKIFRVETLEVVAAQLDECRSLIERDSVTNLRMALILADNAVEVILAHKIENALAMNPIYENYLRLVDEFPDEADDHEHAAEARSKLVSKKERREISRNFDKKVDFLLDRGHIDAAVGACLHKLHEYRNEAYHQGRVREGNLPQAVRIYFGVACTLLEGFGDPSPLMHKLWPLKEIAEAMPTVMKLSKAEEHRVLDVVTPSPSAVARALSSKVKIDTDTLRHDLTSYLRAQIDQIEREIDFCLKYGSHLFDGWKRADMVRMAYMIKAMESGGAALTLEEMRGRRYPTNYNDLERWRGEASDLASLRDRTALFAEFARIENELDPCLESLKDLVTQVDREYEARMDRIRGR